MPDNDKKNRVGSLLRAMRNLITRKGARQGTPENLVGGRNPSSRDDSSTGSSVQSSTGSSVQSSPRGSFTDPESPKASSGTRPSGRLNR